MPVDCFDALPDSLLIHILSFMNVDEAAITSVLSKRWEFLWAESPRLEFSTRIIGTIENFVSWVNRTLAIRTGNYLEKFDVRFHHHILFPSDFDAWVQFATENKVKELNLHIHCLCGLYKPPQAMYSCASLTSLSVEGCILDCQRTIKWHSLTNLHLSLVTLDQRSLDEIFSGCPALNILNLDMCSGFNRVEVNSRSLGSLSISNWESYPPLKISAPYIHSLHIRLPNSETVRKLVFGDISSLVRANIEYTVFTPDFSISKEMMSAAKEFLESVRHVKELCLGKQFTQVVSLVVMTGWQLPQSRLELLMVKSHREYKHKYSVSGIISLLESSPNLETLLIEGYITTQKDFILEPVGEVVLARDLLNLKTVKVTSIVDSEGVLPLTLARILLKRATSLEKMVITTDVDDLSDFEKILTYPKSSTKAVVHLVRCSMSLALFSSEIN